MLSFSLLGTASSSLQPFAEGAGSKRHPQSQCKLRLFPPKLGHVAAQPNARVPASRPPSDTGSCEFKQSCKHICVLPLELSPTRSTKVGGKPPPRSSSMLSTPVDSRGRGFRAISLSETGLDEHRAWLVERMAVSTSLADSRACDRSDSLEAYRIDLAVGNFAVQKGVSLTNEQ